MKIHPTAIIGKNVKLSDNVTIGPYSIIEGNISIDNNTIIDSYVQITGNVHMGKNNRIYSGTVIGTEPQDLSYNINCKSGIIIGDNNTIREHSTIHKAAKNNSNTIIGNNCYLMVNSHIAHDCTVEDNVIIANNVCLSGHVRVGTKAFLSGFVAVHQFCRIGDHVIIGGHGRVKQNIIPFMLVDGETGKINNINVIGLKRAGFVQEQRSNIKKAYKILFKDKKVNISDAIIELKKINDPNVKHIVNFINEVQSNNRGIARNI